MLENNEQDIQEIELSIEQAKATIARRDALVRLTNNPDFKDIVNQGYFEKEASRLVLLKADYEMQDDKQQRLIDNAIIGVGSFRAYLRTIVQFGAMAENQLEQDHKTHDELLSEEEGE